MALAAELWPYPLALTAAYTVFSGALLARWHHAQDVLFFAVPAIIGPLGEMIAVAHGAWVYSNPQFLIPVWLPLGWGCAALLVKKTTDCVVGILSVG
jgi:hypothetical protein